MQILWIIVILTITTILLSQGVFSLTWMLYAWNNPEKMKKFSSPRYYSDPKYRFTALIPARHEQQVIKDTIKAVNNIDYPKHLTEILIICRYDDVETINKALKSLGKLDRERARIIIFNEEPINKPHGLNHGLKEATGDIVTIFDAEDDPHPEIYRVINTIFSKEDVDVVQSGVQLMNYNSNWFSSLNILEYYFWFKSGLQFFTNNAEVTPLGGNTVFFKRSELEKVGGWDQNNLTEDADIGFRLVLNGAKIRIVYNERHVTREETPHSAKEFIKQRTRWVQGFMQILSKGDWSKLPKLKQRVVAGYILSSSIFQTILLIYIPIGLLVSFTVDLPEAIALYTFVPMYILAAQIMVLIVGLYEFTRAYGLKFSIWLPFKLIISYMPYQFMLSASTIRASVRYLKQNTKWEKTTHKNLHRKVGYA